MTFPVVLGLVLAAVYGLLSASISGLVAAVWSAVERRARPTANELLAIRLLPAGGAALIALTVVLPAFLWSEPAQDLEQGGPLLVAMALFSALTLAAGLWRAVRACRAARALLRACGPADQLAPIEGHAVGLVDVQEPIVAVVGGLRPRIVASKRILGTCSSEEFSQIIAHEVAHVSARDNLKLLLLVFAPDLLACLPAGAALEARWRAAAEREADEHATGSDYRKRLALASALIKVARLSVDEAFALPVLSMPVAADDVEGRVRGLLAPALPVQLRRPIRTLAMGALSVPLMGAPLYGSVHRLIEMLVAFGR